MGGVDELVLIPLPKTALLGLEDRRLGVWGFCPRGFCLGPGEWRGEKIKDP